jgi:hypothetical protein
VQPRCDSSRHSITGPRPGQALMAAQSQDLRTLDLVRQPTDNVETTWPQSTEVRA